MVLDVGFRSILALEEFAPSQDCTAHQLFRTRKGPNLMTRFEQKASSNVRKVSVHPFAIYIQISSAAVVVSAVKEVIVRAPSIHLSPCLAWLSRRISNSWRMEDTSAKQLSGLVICHRHVVVTPRRACSGSKCNKWEDVLLFGFVTSSAGPLPCPREQTNTSSQYSKYDNK